MAGDRWRLGPIGVDLPAGESATAPLTRAPPSRRSGGTESPHSADAVEALSVRAPRPTGTRVVVHVLIESVHGRPGPILVVDDEHSVRAAIVTILEADGYEVITAVNGVTALERARHSPPALILLDIWMPEMDGVAFAQEYHRGNSQPAPILLVTASVDGAQWVSATGAVSHLAKPFDIDELLGAVAKHARPAGPYGP
jgi:two-component system response regulator (stage 0 sporulation protein F)